MSLCAGACLAVGVCTFSFQLQVVVVRPRVQSATLDTANVVQARVDPRLTITTSAADPRGKDMKIVSSGSTVALGIGQRIAISRSIQKECLTGFEGQYS